MGFFIRPGKKSFRIIEELWTPNRRVRAVPKEAYPALGFRYDMSVAEAKERASQLNLQDQLKNKKIAQAVRQKTFKDVINTAYLPEKLVKLFTTELHESYHDNESRLETILKHWNTAQLLISALTLDPKDFFPERTKILNYYKSKQWSPDYIKRITKMLNLWGGFCSRHNNAFFQPIPKLSNVQSQKVIELREEKEDVRRPARPLDWDTLKNAKSSFQIGGLIDQWNWLFVALWFGLRPLEVDNLKNKKFWKITKDPDTRIDVLNIYQTKLTSLSKEQRWKPIPVFTKEQKDALEIIKSQELKRPLNKTIQSYLKGEGYETYSPRKGFVDLLLDRGFGLEDISTFLGHNDINTTWRHYKNKKKFRLPPTG